MNLSLLIFGYRYITVNENDATAILSTLLRRGCFVKMINASRLLISERDHTKIEEFLNGKFEYTVSEPRGLYGFMLKNRRRYGVMLGLVAVGVLAFFSYNTVFDVRVSGNVGMSEEEVIEELAAVGFEVGDSWLTENRTASEILLLESSEKIGWININRQGSVAYVEIVEKKLPEEIPSYKYCNIVAGADCVIEEISVKKGYAAVKVGDVVKRGEVLISGIPDDSVGEFCAAEGVVVGRVNESFEVYFEREQVLKIDKNENLYGFAVKIFNFSINIFKIYGNSVSECDIIERKAQCSLFGKRLPVKLLYSYEKEYDTVMKEFSESELARLARDEISRKILSTVGGGELLKIKTNGNFDAAGYGVSTEIIYLANVATAVPFEVD